MGTTTPQFREAHIPYTSGGICASRNCGVVVPILNIGTCQAPSCHPNCAAGSPCEDSTDCSMTPDMLSCVTTGPGPYTCQLAGCRDAGTCPVGNYCDDSMQSQCCSGAC